MRLWWAIKGLESESKAFLINPHYYGILWLSMKHPLGNVFMEFLFQILFSDYCA